MCLRGNQAGTDFVFQIVVENRLGLLLTLTNDEDGVPTADG
jgi:hypothetical protein